MNEDLANLETELRSLIPKDPAPELMRRIAATVAAGPTHVAVSDWIFVGTILTGVASAVVIAVLFAAQGSPQHRNWQSAALQTPLVQSHWTRADRCLALLGRNDGASAAEFAGLMYP